MPIPINIRKNWLKISFNKHQGYIEEMIMNFTIVDEKGKDMETREISVFDYYNTMSESIQDAISNFVDFDETTFVGFHTTAEKIEYYVNSVLDDIKNSQGIKE